jgi:hypothetical protein
MKPFLCLKEIEPHVASELCRLFPMDGGVPWNDVLKKSKETAKTVGHVKVTAPIGSPGGMMMGMKGRGGIGLRDRRDLRGRPPAPFRNMRPFDYGRYNSGLLFRMTSVSANELCGLALSPLIIS